MGWTHKLLLSSLKSEPLQDEIEKEGGIKLIYIAPPFDVNADFSMGRKYQQIHYRTLSIPFST